MTSAASSNVQSKPVRRIGRPLLTTTISNVTCNKRGTKTYEEHMIYGSPYEQLVAVNGKPPSPEQQAQEQQKLEAAIVERPERIPEGTGATNRAV